MQLPLCTELSFNDHFHHIVNTFGAFQALLKHRSLLCLYLSESGMSKIIKENSFNGLTVNSPLLVNSSYAILELSHFENS